MSDNNKKERTFIALKPDATKRKLIGKIISRFEDLGFDLVAMKMMYITKELATEHYKEHTGKPFFPGLLEFITSGSIIATAWEGDSVIKIVRKIVGSTNCAEAAAGTIRGDLGISNRENLIHASDSSDSAKRELKLFFPELY